MESSLNHGAVTGNVKEQVDNNNNNSNNNNNTRSSCTGSSSSNNNNNNNNINSSTSSNNSKHNYSDTTITITATTTTTNLLVQDVSEDNTRQQSFTTRASVACGGMYQLRPRSLQARRRSDSDCEWSLQDTLRHKSRPPPLSRYRRKTANARERYRMRQINTAFECLRGVLPSWVCNRRAVADMTKITTLKLASAYIRSLQDILDGNASGDTCSWVLSNILGEAESSKVSQSEPIKTQHTPPNTRQDPDFVSLLCSSSDTAAFQDNFDSISYLSPMSETEAVALLLGSDPSRGWSDALHAQLVT